MYVGKVFDIKTLWPFAKKNLIRTVISSTIVTSMYFFLDWTFLAVPFLPIGTIGTAVAFYVGFKNNQAYERLWEARKLWGGITNNSRILTATVRSVITDKDTQKDILYRHIAYINLLRLQLRKTIPWATSKENIHQNSVLEAEELLEYKQAIIKLYEKMGRMDIYEMVKDRVNIATNALQQQYQEVGKLKRAKIIDDFEHSDLLKIFNEFYNLQGSCERIKTTPLFRQFSIFSRIFVVLFIFLLPFGLLTSMNDLEHIGHMGVWLTIPFASLISWVFFTMEQIGEFSENPFDNGINDIPIATICRNIDIDMR
ncbi:MAG: bestrophin family protein, partial [Bacteroidia bacterium]